MTSHISKQTSETPGHLSLHTTLINNTTLSYIDIGEGPAVVLIHGFCGSSSYWEQLIPQLSSSYRVIAPDLRGHGQSPTGQATNTMELLADDIAALLQQLHIEQAAVFGHSLGGYVTLALVERHPELVRKFSLVHSTALPDTEEGKAKRLQGKRSIQEHGIIPYVDGLIPKLFAEAHLNTMPDRVRVALELGYQTSPEGAVNSLEGMRIRPDRSHVLRDHLIPILLVAGSDDLVVAPERTFNVAGSHIQQVLIEGTGHMSMLEAPEQLLTIMTSFVTGV